MDALEIEIKSLATNVANVKNIADTANGTTVELKSQITGLQAKIATMEEKFSAGVVNPEDISALKTEFQNTVDGLILKMQENQREKKSKLRTFEEAFAESYEAKKAEIDGIVERGGRQMGPLVFEMKDVVTIQTNNTIGAGATHFSLTADTGIISVIRKRLVKYLKYVSVGFMSPLKPYAMWIEEYNEQGTPIFIGEGVAKTQVSVLYQEKEKKAVKIPIYGKVSTEMLRYLPQLIAYIQNNLMKRLDITTEDGLFNGDGTGSNLTGAFTYATAFDGGGLAGTIASPSVYDVIRAVSLQSQNAYGQPNGIFVHPTQIAAMDLAKDSQGRYLIPPFLSADGKIIGGMEIIGTNALTTDQFLGGDLSVLNVFFTQNMTVQVGLDGNDFTNNKKTILVEQELVQFVSANDTQVLVQGLFSTAAQILAKA
jgi:HK97 family phage major capsid protein